MSANQVAPDYFTTRKHFALACMTAKRERRMADAKQYLNAVRTIDKRREANNG